MAFEDGYEDEAEELTPEEEREQLIARQIEEISDVALTLAAGYAGQPGMKLDVAIREAWTLGVMGYYQGKKDYLQRMGIIPPDEEKAYAEPETNTEDQQSPERSEPET